MNIRKVTPEDKYLLLKWRNEYEERLNSFSLNLISVKEHNGWFEEKMKDSTVFMYIGSEKLLPVGQVRFDIIDDEVVIDISIDRLYRGKGYGTELLKLAIEEFNKNFDESKLVAKIKPENHRSIRIFEKAGFINCGDGEFAFQKFIKFERIKNVCKK